MKNIVIFCPEDKFSSDQLFALNSAGNTTFIAEEDYSTAKLKEADILAIPNEESKLTSSWLLEVLKNAPQVKGLVVNSSDSSFIDQAYCRERGISVSVIPEHTSQAQAEYVMLLLLGAARNVFIHGWRAYKRKFITAPGIELKGKTLGIVGLDSVSQKLIEIGRLLDMRIYLYNPKPISAFAERKSLSEVLRSSDLITIHLPDTEENQGFFSKERINTIKEGSIVVNIAGPQLFDQKALAHALNDGRINQYLFEVEKAVHSPLQNICRALSFKKQSTNTWESKRRSKAIWIENIINMARGTPSNRLV